MHLPCTRCDKSGRLRGKISKHILFEIVHEQGSVFAHLRPLPTPMTIRRLLFLFSFPCVFAQRLLCCLESSSWASGPPVTPPTWAELLLHLVSAFPFALAPWPRGPCPVSLSAACLSPRRELQRAGARSISIFLSTQQVFRECALNKQTNNSISKRKQ